MIVSKTKRKVIIKKILITSFERFMPIDIKLPANVRKVTGIMVTTSTPVFD